MTDPESCMSIWEVEQPMTDLIEELAICPAPWCSSDNIKIEHPNRYYHAACLACGCQGPACETEAGAVSEWNDRPAILPIIEREKATAAPVELAGLVEELRQCAREIDPCMVGGRDAKMLNRAATAIEALSRQFEAGDARHD